MAAPLSTFYPELRLEFMAAPLPILDEAIRKGAIRVAGHSWLVRETLTKDIEADTRSYELDASDPQHEVCAVVTARLADREFDPAASSSNMLNGAQTGDPKFFLYEDKLLYLYPIPIVAETMTVRAVLRPKRTAASLLDKFADDDDLYNATLAGAKRYLAGMANQPWSQPAMVPFFETEFWRHADQARIRALRGDTDVGMTVIQTAFGNR